MDSRRKHDHEWSDEGSQRVKTTLGSSTAKRRMERTKRRYVVREKSTTQSRRTRRTKREQTSTRPSPHELHEESNIVENARK